MGFAKYHEDLVSRFNNDNQHEARPAPRHKPVIPPAKEARKMSRLKEFTTQAARPLPLIVLADVSGSMESDGKIVALNHAVREMLESFQDEADLRAEIHVSVVTFGGQAQVLVPLGPVRNASWTDVKASGGTPMGTAFDLARLMVEDKAVVSSRAYRPTIVLVSDGQPTPPGSEVEPLRQLLASERGGKAFRMALAIGADADHGVLQAFLADPEARVYRADEARQIRQFFQLVTMSVSTRSRSANPNSTPPTLSNDGWDL